MEIAMSRKLLVIAALQFILAGCMTTVPTITPSRDVTPLGQTAAGRFKNLRDAKVVLVILENKNADEAYTNRNRFLWRLADEGAYLSNYHGIAHPSQPNYVALISGSTKGV